jgi:hypothetical protein
MTDSTRQAQEERAKRLRQQIQEIATPTSQGAGDAPRTPRDFTNPARPAISPDKGTKNP